MNFKRWSLALGFVALFLSACSGGGGAGQSTLPNIAASTSVVSTSGNVAPGGLNRGARLPDMRGRLAPGAMPAVRPAATPTPVSTAPVPVTMTYTFGTAHSAAVTQSLAQRRPFQSSAYTGYTSTAAPISISLNVTPLGGTLANYTGSCTAAVSGASGTCSVTFTAAPGPTTFAGTITESTNTIAKFSQIEIVQPGGAQSINFTANPVVASVGLALSAPTTYSGNPAVSAGTPYDVPLSVNAYDANGNIIAAAANYVDSNGNPIAIMLATVNSQAGGRGRAYIKGPGYITAPGQAAITLHYDGNWLDHTIVTATSSSSAVNMTGATVTLATVPTTTEYSSGISANALPTGITAGPDGNLWFTECGSDCLGSHEGIGRITTSGTVTEFSSGISANAGPKTITLGPDGNLWFAECGIVCGEAHEGVGRITTSGNVTEFSSGISAHARSPSITTGPDGNLWFTECGAYCGEGHEGIGRITTSGSVTEFSSGISTNAGNIFAQQGIAAGPDGNLWFTECGAYCGEAHEGIGRITTRGSVTEFSSGISTNASPLGIAQGPDGNLWFAECGLICGEAHEGIGRITTSGNVTEFSSGISANASPLGIAQGPDGNLWFTECGAYCGEAHEGIGRITTSGTVTEFTSGISANASPNSITAGPDGNFWFTEFNGNAIGKFVL